MSIYFSSTLMWNKSLDEIMKKAYLEGFQGIELWMQQVEYKKYSVNECKQALKKNPIDITIHAYSWDLNLSSLNEGIRKASINEILKSIDYAHLIKAKDVTIHPGRKTIFGFEDNNKELLYKSLKEISDYAKEKNIIISLEIMEKVSKEFITSDIELKECIKNLYEDFQYTLDVAHCTNEEEVFNYLNSVDRISKIHISNKIGNKLHTPLSIGDYDFQELLFKLEETNNPLVIEGIDYSDDLDILENNINFIKSIKGEISCQRKAN